MTEPLILPLVLGLILGIPLLIFGAMVYAYQGDESRTVRVLDTFLFHPYVVIAFLAYAGMIGSIMFDDEWGLGLSFPFGVELSAPLMNLIIPLGLVMSIAYLLIVRPKDTGAVLNTLNLGGRPPEIIDGEPPEADNGKSPEVDKDTRQQHRGG